MTLQNERPFSFYNRDKCRVKKVKIVDVPVKIYANPIPKSTKSNLFEKIQEKEEMLEQMLCMTLSISLSE